MLTPTVHDKNRAEELKRKERDPVAFGAAHEQKIKDALKLKEEAAKTK